MRRQDWPAVGHVLVEGKGFVGPALHYLSNLRTALLHRAV